MSMKRARIGVLASGGGTNLQCIIDACERGEIDADVAVVISNVPEAFALERAKKHRIDAYAFPHKGVTREQHEADIIECLDQHGVDLVVLAGYLRILTPVFINKYAGRLMNTHPALLPAFPGLDAQRQAWEHGAKVSGATVHLVDEGLDTGPVIARCPVDLRGAALFVQRPDARPGAQAAHKTVFFRHGINNP